MPPSVASSFVWCELRGAVYSFLLDLTIEKCLPQFSGWSVFLRGQWNTADFITSYLPLALFPVLYIVSKLWTRVPAVGPSEMDFYTGLAEIEASTYDEPPPRNKLEAFWGWLVSDDSVSFVCVPSSSLNRCNTVYAQFEQTHIQYITCSLSF
jgi:hypothetical protein